MDSQHIDELLNELSSSPIPSGPSPRQVLGSLRHLRDSGAAPEPMLAWLSFSQLSAVLATLALLLGLAGGFLTASASRETTVAQVRDSLRLTVFDIDSTRLPHQTLLGR